jgi:hypothetical protein
MSLLCFSTQTFAIRFSSAEIATEFKTAFEAGQKEMNALMAGADDATGGAEADAAADAISKVGIKSEGAEPAQENTTQTPEKADK